MCVCVCVCVCFGLVLRQGTITASKGYGALLDWVPFDDHYWLWHPTGTQPRAVGHEAGHLTHPRYHGLEQDPGFCLHASLL